MRKYLFFIVILSVLVYSCSETEPEVSLIDNTITANLEGEIRFTNDTVRVQNNLNQDNWTLGINSKLEVKVSKNLTSNPFNLKLTIDTDTTDATSPKLSFISDFDRKIIPGDRYRLISTLNLFGSTSFVQGNTGGQIKFNEVKEAYGFEIGSELEINIASEGNTIIGNSSQYLVLSGNFTFDNNANAGLKVGDFNIRIDGNNIVDTSVF